MKIKAVRGSACLGMVILLGMSLVMTSCGGSSLSTGASEDAYNIDQKRNVNRVRVVKAGDDKNSVEIVLKARGGMTTANPENVQLTGSTGVQRSSSTFRGFDNVSFPFNGRVTFEYTKQKFDALGGPGETQSIASTLNALSSFTIKKPGRWIVTVYY